jgi:hypothetical protein
MQSAELDGAYRASYQAKPERTLEAATEPQRLVRGFFGFFDPHNETCRDVVLPDHAPRLGFRIFEIKAI